MATDYPVTLEELKNIQGVGEGKVKQPYAKEFVDLIARYCEENDIERQVDMRVRTVAKKSMLKVRILPIPLLKKLRLSTVSDHLSYHIFRMILIRSRSLLRLFPNRQVNILLLLMIPLRMVQSRPI